MKWLLVIGLSTCAFADYLILMDGRVIETDGPVTISTSTVKYRGKDGGLYQLPSRYVDFKNTRIINLDPAAYFEARSNAKKRAEEKKKEEERAKADTQKKGPVIKLDGDDLNEYVVKKRVIEDELSQFVGIWEVEKDDDGLVKPGSLLTVYPDGRCSLSLEGGEPIYWMDVEEGHIALTDFSDNKPLQRRMYNFENGHLNLENRYQGYTRYKKTTKIPLPLKRNWLEHSGYFFFNYPDDWRVSSFEGNSDFGTGFVVANRLMKQSIVFGYFPHQNRRVSFSGEYAENFIFGLLATFLDQVPNGRVSVRRVYSNDYYGRRGYYYNAQFIRNEQRQQMDLFFPHNRTSHYFIFHFRVGPPTNDAKRILSSLRFLPDR